jgi:Type III restriction enzyme, res subunit
VVEKGKPRKNARILIATDEAEANFLLANNPENYFSHIVIDECHRSAWGKWLQILDRNPNAVQIGLTATPRQIVLSEATAKTAVARDEHADQVAIALNNLYADWRQRQGGRRLEPYAFKCTTQSSASLPLSPGGMNS